MGSVQFVVEHAGCMSCAARIRDALAELGTVGKVDVDEVVDVAVVRMSAAEVSESRVNDVLRTASEGSGHIYRIRPGSWCSV
jgi:copper chaperone CopZ